MGATSPGEAVMANRMLSRPEFSDPGSVCPRHGWPASPVERRCFRTWVVVVSSFEGLVMQILSLPVDQSHRRRSAGRGVPPIPLRSRYEFGHVGDGNPRQGGKRLPRCPAGPFDGQPVGDSFGRALLTSSGPGSLIGSGSGRDPAAHPRYCFGIGSFAIIRGDVALRPAHPDSGNRSRGADSASPGRPGSWGGAVRGRTA